jgi:NitT/TauT family transport system ATP-binding protein
LKQIKSALESKSDHTLPDDFFHDILDEHFTEEETVRQLETAINWGRYAELFDHDAERKRFFIPEEAASAPPNVEVETQT